MRYGNIASDPRVIRGNTYRQQAFPTASDVDPVALQREQEAARRRRAQQRAKERARTRSPEPVPGRVHMDVQTELYLEELTDRVEEADVATATDPFLDRPPSPLFIPAKTGVDAATQILDGDLFNFDLEVQPILEVLVGKTCEQALMEVMEEEELDRIRDHQREYEELRNAELIETQRLEEQARRRREEKQRRLQQQKEVLQSQQEASEKIAARAFAQSYLSGLQSTVFGALDDGGYFFDVQNRAVETDFMPWLMDGVDDELSRYTRARDILDNMLAEVVAARAAAYAPPPPPPEPEPEPEEPEAGAAKVRITLDDATAAFTEADVDGTGAVSVEEIQKLEERFGLPPTVAADAEKWADGVVKLDEFIEMLKETGSLAVAEAEQQDADAAAPGAEQQEEDANAAPEAAEAAGSAEAGEAADPTPDA